MSAVHLNLLHHEEHLSYFPEATKKIVVFYKYQYSSAKDHDRVRKLVELYLTMTSSLQSKKRVQRAGIDTAKHHT